MALQAGRTHREFCIGPVHYAKEPFGPVVTDSCVNRDTTVEMLDKLAESVRKRRATFIA